MKNKFLYVIIIVILGRSAFSNPVAGVSGISGNTERASTISLIIEQHLIDILKKQNFSTIPPTVIRRELVKFNCIEEKCVLSFAENADIDLLISGSVIDKKSFLSIRFEAYGINIPFNKRIINKYEVRVPMNVSVTSREFSLLSEEHCAVFLSRTMDNFLYPAAFKISGNSLILENEMKLSGKYTFYTRDGSNRIKDAGEIELTEGGMSIAADSLPAEKSFIFISYKKNSREITEYYEARKREIVFKESSLYDTLFMFAVIPAASASMPFSSPFLGYYKNNDWQGLGLWMVNAPPYLYMEARGLINSPDRLKEQKKDITRDDMAMHYFGWYMLLAGGMPLFIDSYAVNYLHQTTYFAGNNEFLGNTATAAMLSLTSNGAGLFYRGKRGWGYFYFHLNNILLYMTIREFSNAEYYNPDSDSYNRNNNNRGKGLTYCSIFALSKTIEIIHAVTAKETISSGEVIDEYIIPGPLFTLDEKGHPYFGAAVTLKF